MVSLLGSFETETAHYVQDTWEDTLENNSIWVGGSTAMCTDWMDGWLDGYIRLGTSLTCYSHMYVGIYWMEFNLFCLFYGFHSVSNMTKNSFSVDIAPPRIVTSYWTYTLYTVERELVLVIPSWYEKMSKKQEIFWDPYKGQEIIHLSESELWNHPPPPPKKKKNVLWL